MWLSDGGRDMEEGAAEGSAAAGPACCGADAEDEALAPESEDSQCDDEETVGDDASQLVLSA